MKDNEGTSEFGSYMALFRRRRVWILTVFPAVLLLAVYIAYALPPKYRSTATVLLVQGTIPEQFIQGTVSSSADEEIQTIQGRVMTVDELRGLVKQYDPYPDEKDWDVDRKAQQVILDTDMERVDPVTFEVLLKSPAFSLHYENPDPRRSAIFTKYLANMFLSYHQHEREGAAGAAAKLIRDRADELAKELQQVDQQYAVLRAQHGGILPDSTAQGDEARYRAERDMNDLDKQLRTAQEQVSLLSIQLSNTSPNLLAAQGLGNVNNPNNASFAASGGLTDLATVKALLADAELRYTPDHPDVKRLKRALATLEAQQAQNGGKPVEADNPEYRRIQSELVAARAEVAALQTATARAREQVAQYAANSNPSAQLAQQVAELDRKRGSLQTEYADVQGKLKGALLGQDIESDPHAEHFTMLRAPTIPTTPYSPNRLGVILLGLVLGVGLAAVAVSVAEGADATVRGTRDLGGLGNIQLLGSISEIVTPGDQRRRRLVWGSVTAAYLLAAVVVTLTVVHAEVRDHLVQLSSQNST